MGDRASIYIVENSEFEHGIYLYSHFNGYILHDELAKALTFGSSRWDDPSYLTRIIISQVFKDENDGLLGAGVSTFPTYGEYPIIVVDTAGQRVYAVQEGQEKYYPDELSLHFDYTFTEFVSKTHTAREYGEAE